MEITDTKMCRIHKYDDYIFEATNFKLESLVKSRRLYPRKKTSSIRERASELYRRLKASPRLNKLPVCEECITSLKKISEKRKKLEINYPYLLDLAIWDDIGRSSTTYADKGLYYNLLLIPSPEIKLPWQDFLKFIKTKYYSTEDIKDVSLLLRKLLVVPDEMVREDMAWYSEKDYLSKIEQKTE